MFLKEKNVDLKHELRTKILFSGDESSLKFLTTIIYQKTKYEIQNTVKIFNTTTKNE